MATSRRVRGTRTLCAPGSPGVNQAVPTRGTASLTHWDGDQRTVEQRRIERVDHPGQLRRVHRAAEQEALQVPAAQLAQRGELAGCLHALRDDVDGQPPA